MNDREQADHALVKILDALRRLDRAGYTLEIYGESASNYGVAAVPKKR